MTIKINTDTGLPELPEGHFWRVKTEFGVYHKVQLREEINLLGFRIGSFELASRHLLELSKGEINRQALKLHGEYYTTVSQKNLLGDYPPKSLNG